MFHMLCFCFFQTTLIANDVLVTEQIVFSCTVKQIFFSLYSRANHSKTPSILRLQETDDCSASHRTYQKNSQCNSYIQLISKTHYSISRRISDPNKQLLGIFLLTKH